eukprot:1186359-Prorocentrum_minimum.AAC.2
MRLIRLFKLIRLTRLRLPHPLSTDAADQAVQADPAEPAGEAVGGGAVWGGAATGGAPLQAPLSRGALHARHELPLALHARHEPPAGCPYGGPLRRLVRAPWLACGGGTAGGPGRARADVADGVLPGELARVASGLALPDLPLLDGDHLHISGLRRHPPAERRRARLRRAHHGAPNFYYFIPVHPYPLHVLICTRMYSYVLACTHMYSHVLT